MREQPHKPRVNAIARDPDRWGPVDLIIAGTGMASFLTLLGSVAWHLVTGTPL